MAARLTTYLVVAIVCGTLIAGLIVGAQRSDVEGPVDIIVHNAKVYTADSSGTMAEAVAIRGNQILRVGSNREILRLQRPQTAMIDANGAAVVPGFNDADVQFIEGGFALDAIDLAGAADVAEIQARVRAWSDANPDRPWVLGRGWDRSVLPQGTTPRELLDASVPDRPAQIASADGSTAWVNSMALQAARITRRTPGPRSGTIAKDARTGEPNGLLTGDAVQLVARAAPRPGRAARVAALHAAIAEAHRYGITSIQHIGASVDDLELYAEARRDGELDLRVYAAVPVSGAATDAELTRLDALANKYPDDPLLKAGAVTIAIDGTLAADTAAMLEPLSGRAGVASPFITPDDLNRIVRLLDARGWQIVSHAAGDRAVRMALDAYEHAVRSNPAGPRGRRHRIDGVEIVDPADLLRIRSLGTLVSMETLSTGSAPAIDAWTNLLGPDRAARAWALGSVASAGVRLVAGSGWPSGAFSPMSGLHVAVNRTPPAGDPDSRWNPSERLTLKRAIDAATSAAAYASFDEHRKGTLKAGMLADLVVLSDNIFSIPSSRLAATEVAATIFDGKIVYRRARNSVP